MRSSFLAPAASLALSLAVFAGCDAPVDNQARHPAKAVPESTPDRRARRWKARRWKARRWKARRWKAPRRPSRPPRSLAEPK